MLRSLSIRDVVLIDQLTLTFDNALCVLTGETGAGKSILLDSLGLALGMRAEARLVRHGASQASVTAEFDLPDGPQVAALLEEQSIATEDGSLLLRRTLAPDGRSRAFINDQPVSVGLLRQLGDLLVEIHGQFESQKLTNPAAHRGLLDAFSGATDALGAVSSTWQAWRAAAAARKTAAESLEQARREEDFLRHTVDELGALAPEPGEAETLAQERARLMHGEKLAEALQEAAAALNEGRGVETGLLGALRALERVRENAAGALDGTIDALERALSEAAEGQAQLDRASAELDLDPAHLERAEERLFALRAQARKHDVDVDDLAGLLERFQSQLAALEDGGADLARLEAEEATARQAYIRAAERLSAARTQAAAALDHAVAAELEPLKLGKAAFVTCVEPLSEEKWGGDGMDDVAFRVATNPGAPPGPLNKIASGGELSRFMLALKAVLASADQVPTLVFDEVDAGIGGATAAAVGERLAALGGQAQVLVVTHSPQVAARGGQHMRVSKAGIESTTRTTVEPLDAKAREEEIARMLAGTEVTTEARAAAQSLLARAS